MDAIIESVIRKGGGGVGIEIKNKNLGFLGREIPG